MIGPRAALLACLALAAPSPSPAQDETQVSWDGARSSVGEWFGRLWPLRRAPARPAAAGGAELRVVSWNLQAFGGSVSPRRRQAMTDAVRSLFADPKTKALVAIELANERGASALRRMLPRGPGWAVVFEDSSDSQDNGLVLHPAVEVACRSTVFLDRERSRHPARFAHLRVGDFDFAIVALHLEFDAGRAEASVAELRHILDWLRDSYLSRAGADPDVILVGDFNLPTRKGKAASLRGGEADWTELETVLADYPTLGLTALVDEPSSRAKAGAANNYDHFLISRDLLAEEYVAGSAGVIAADEIARIERARRVRVSDHLPIGALFRTAGAGSDGRPVAADGHGSCPR